MTGWGRETREHSRETRHGVNKAEACQATSQAAPSPYITLHSVAVAWMENVSGSRGTSRTAPTNL